MPLYEYKCSGCGKTFEVIQKFSDEPLTTHPECGGPAERLLSPPALQFKGSGWYVTDYARSGEKKSNGSGKPETGDKKSGSDSSSSESKPAASTETKSSSTPPSTSTPK
jgi:putative FmdB family regulatory protein